MHKTNKSHFLDRAPVLACEEYSWIEVQPSHQLSSGTFRQFSSDLRRSSTLTTAEIQKERRLDKK